MLKKIKTRIKERTIEINENIATEQYLAQIKYIKEKKN